MDFEDLTLKDVSVLFAILFGSLIILSIISIVITSVQKAKDSSYPIQKKHAKVLEKEQLPVGAIVADVKVWFETEDGDRLRLRAKPQNKLFPGDEGLLTWQGTKIMNFEREFSFKNK